MVDHFEWPEDGIDISGAPEKPKFTDPSAAFGGQEWYPCISNRWEWDAYFDVELQEMERWLRGWLQQLIDQAPTTREQRKMTLKYALGMMYGEEVNTHNFGPQCRKMTILLKYYCSRIQRAGAWFRGQPNNSGVIYTLSPPRLRYLPYSLGLRFEFLQAKGKMPDVEDMKKWYQDKEQANTGKPAWARHPRFQARLTAKAQEAQEYWREYKEEKQRAEQSGTSYISKRDPSKPGRKAHKPVPDPDYGRGSPEERKRVKTVRLLDS